MIYMNTDGTSISLSFFDTSIKSSSFYNIDCICDPCGEAWGRYSPNALNISVIECIEPTIISEKIHEKYSIDILTKFV